MIFAGIQKTTLLDYPGKVAATLFTYGCNFRCPFCHNPELVIESLTNNQIIPEGYIFDFMSSRKEKLDALVITGGEPMINNDLPDFIRKIKKFGFLVKVDTNGSFPKMIEYLSNERIVDYWAMDIKNSEERYLETNGLLSCVGYDLDKKSMLSEIKNSISIIKNSGVEYEFRTTVVPDLHDDESVHGIGELINNSKNFYIQNFRAGKTLDKSYYNKRSFTPAELERFKDIMKPYVEKVEIRGI